MRAIPVIAAYAARESLRRRVFLVVAVLTLAFLFLYRLGARFTFDEADVFPPVGVEPVDVIGSTLLGLAMFGTLFLGCVLAVFLTLGAVRGDAERGLLQPLVVRPVSREAFLAGRFAGAAAICAVYVVLVFLALVVITRWAGGWWPDRILAPALELAGAIVVLVGLSILGSVYLSAVANGIAVFMLFGAGLLAGLLGQLGEALNSDTLTRVADRTSWALPFEALYQDALGRLTVDTVGLTRFVVELGPFGGGHDYGKSLFLWSLAYLGLIAAAAAWGFRRTDL